MTIVSFEEIVGKTLRNAIFSSDFSTLILTDEDYHVYKLEETTKTGKLHLDGSLEYLIGSEIMVAQTIFASYKTTYHFITHKGYVYIE